MTRAILTLAGTLLCLQSECAQAHAQTARDALSVLCPTARISAPLIEAAAAESRVPAVVLVAMARAESSCGTDPVNRRTHSYGLLQIKVDGSANVDHLEGPELLDPEVNVPTGARHLRKWIGLCGSLDGGLTIYHGRKGAFHGKGHCDVDGYARRVLGLVARARRMIAKMGERRS